MPTSSGASLAASPSGLSSGRKTLHGHSVFVEKLQLLAAASALPATSFGPAAPEATVTV